MPLDAAHLALYLNLMKNRILALDGVRNFRDFGGYTSSYGGKVASGRLYRSGHYAEATEADIAAVNARKIVHQTDLRRPDERDRMKAKWSAPHLNTNDGGRETDAPHTRFLQQVEASAEVADNWMNEYYEKAPFKPHHIDLFKGWFAALETLGPDQAALVNCAAGKDRTGILCALTHHVLGVSRTDIFADYDLTNQAAEVDARLPEATAYFNDLLKKDYAGEVYRPFMGVHVRYLETAFQTIGNIDAYLTDTLGLGVARQDTLRQSFLLGD